MAKTPCSHCSFTQGHDPRCLVVFVKKHHETAASVPRFVGVGPKVIIGQREIARACSKTMAKRIANALNRYVPNKEGV